MRSATVVALMILAGAVSARAGSHYSLAQSPDRPLYFGYVVSCDRPAEGAPGAEVLRAGPPEQAEPATPNTPLTPGDRLVTPAGVRCEAEFDTGTLVQLDGDSRLRIETVLAYSLTSSKTLTNFALERGRARIRYREFDRNEVFQVLTGQAAVKIARGATVEVAVRDEQPEETVVAVEQGEAAVLYGSDAKETRKKTVGSGGRLRLVANREAPLTVAASEADAFGPWAVARDQARFTPPTDTRPLPSTLRDQPPAVQAFAERMSRTHGKWVWSKGKEHAWRPNQSDDPFWRPYLHGRFATVQGQSFWVGDEPWGWVPYHLGFWDLDQDAGWLWFPGSSFAPAWVTWGGCDDYYGWTAFGPSHWFSYRYGQAWIPPDCGLSNLAWYQYPWEYDTSVPVPDPAPRYAKRRGSPTPPIPKPSWERHRLPRHLRDLGDQLERMAERNGPGADRRQVAFSVMESPRRPGNRGADDAAAPASGNERAGRPGAAPPAEGAAEAKPRTGGKTDGTTEDKPVESRPAPATAEASDPAPAPAPSAAAISDAFRQLIGPGSRRFRDWNPDVRAARVAGVSLRYDSAANRVVCVGCVAPGGGGSATLGGSGDGSASGFGGTNAGGSSGTAAAAGAMAGGGTVGSSRGGPIDR